MTSSPRFFELSLEGNGIYLLFLVNNQKKKKKFPVWKLKAICFSFYFPSSLAFFHSPLSLSPTLRTHSSAGSLVTLFDYLRFNENVGFVVGIKTRAILVPTQHRCLGLFT